MLSRCCLHPPFFLFFLHRHMGEAARPSDEHMSHADSHSHKARITSSSVTVTDRPQQQEASIYIFTQRASCSSATQLTVWLIMSTRRFSSLNPDLNKTAWRSKIRISVCSKNSSERIVKRKVKDKKKVWELMENILLSNSTTFWHQQCFSTFQNTDNNVYQGIFGQSNRTLNIWYQPMPRQIWPPPWRWRFESDGCGTLPKTWLKYDLNGRKWERVTHSLGPL